MPFPVKLRNGISNKLQFTGLGMKPSEACRQIPTFNGVDQELVIPLLSIVGDYEITANIVFNDQSVSVFGNTATQSRFNIDPDGSINWRAGQSNVNTAIAPAGSVTASSKKIRCVRTGVSGIIEVDGVQVFSGSVTNANCDITRIQRSGSGYGNDSVYNVNLNNSRFYPMDDGFVNNPNARETIAGQTGTFNNMTSGSWGEVCE